MPKKLPEVYPKILSNRYGKVKIYHSPNRGRWEKYVVTWSVGRVRHRKTFSDPVKADNHADVVLTQIGNGQPLAGHMTASDALYYESCRKRLAGVPLMVAVDYYLSMHGGGDASDSPTVGKVRDAFVKDITARGNSDRDLGSVRSHLKDFCDSFAVPMVTIKATDIDRYLQSKVCSNRTRHNIRGSLCRLWKWAKQKGVLPRNLDSAADLSSTYKSERAASPGIFTPAQLGEILAAAEDRWLPYLTIAAFAGIRQAELCRLTWADINLEERVIVLGANVTKTNKRRVAHMPDNLVKWLQSVEAEKEGAICPATRPNVETKRISAAAKIAWVDNGLRHSYISYQMALLRDAAKVAEQCGNSESQVQASYKANALESEARKWFGIEPEL
jgi:integrase